jgi:hypothetical protein
MKKVFTSLAFTLLAATLLFSSCDKVNSDDLEEDVPYYQTYEVNFDGSNHETLAYGYFRARGSGGAAIELGDESSLQVNGNATVKNNFLSLVVPTYSWQSTTLTDVTFTLNKKGGKVITNSVPLNTIDPVGFPAMPTNFSRAAGINFNYTGNDGAIEVTIKGKDLSGQDVNITRTFTTSAVSFSSSELSGINNGAIEISMTRAKEMNLTNSDESIGGLIKIRYNVHNSYMLTT